MGRPRKTTTAGPEQAMTSAMESQESQEISADSSYGDDVQLGNELKEEITSLPAELSTPEIIQEVEAEEDLFTSEELQAMQSGWTPKEAFHGDSSKWRNAKAWNEKNNINSVVNEQKQRIAEMEKTQQEMFALIKEERSRNAQIQLTAIEKDRDDAIRMSDIEKVKMLDDVIYSLKGIVNNKPAASSQPVPQAPVEEPNEVKSFKDRNKWFNGSDDLSKRKTTYAQFLENDLNMKKTTMSLSDKLAYIENEVSQIFDGAKKNASPVETRRASMNTNNSNGLPEYNSLPTEAKKLIEYYANKEEFKAKRGNKPFNKAQYRANYVKELIADRVIDNNGKVLPQTRGK
jgi:hypothetical protein